MMQNILFTCAGRRNYLINYFKDALNGQGKVFATDQSVTAPAMVDADIAIKVPGIYANDYIKTLIAIIEEHKITAVISLNDLELPILSGNKAVIEATGAQLIVSDEQVINSASDKWETFKFIEQLGLNSPKSYIALEKSLEAIKNGDIQFPLVLKPRWGSASFGIYFPQNETELKLAYKLQQLELERSIFNEVSKSDMDHAILIQEKLGGIEYGMDVLNDFKGNYRATFAREKLSMRSGETDKAVSIIDPQLEDIGRSIGENLKHIGNLDCDVFKSNNNYYVLELNPRFGGGYPFSHEAGVNTAAIYIEWLNNSDDIDRFINYKEGLSFSKCDRLINITDRS
ncbi:MAG: ATP-grasp domain-containing protein [Flavobacteriaceae bacterium]|nr:ATP-grasp domain-containing protein [Flavobacteriaceae bacterium]